MARFRACVARSVRLGRRKTSQLSRATAYRLRAQSSRLSKAEREQIISRAVLETIRKLVAKPRVYLRGQKKLPALVAFPEAQSYMTEKWATLTKGQLSNSCIPASSKFYKILRSRGITKPAHTYSVINNFVASFVEKTGVCAAAGGW